MSLKRNSSAMFATPAMKRRARKLRWADPLPVSTEPAHSLSAFGEARKPWRVLVAEDQSLLRDIAVDTLARNGMIVRKTSRPDYIVLAVRRFKPHVVVLDDFFSRSGVEFSSILPTLKERFPGVRVIVTSDSDRTALGYSGDPVNWGAWDVVSKSAMRTQQGQEALVKSVRSAFKD